MQRGWLGALWQRSTIVSVVFSQGGIVFGKICRVELVGLGEELRWLSKLLGLDCRNLVYLLEFVYVALEFRRDGRSRGRVFADLT